ncbi:MAG: hypothetical protein NVS3B12_08700 [Acidimicrobiales bacterium]
MTEAARDAAPRLMRLRFAGRCEICGAELAAQSQAWYDPTRKKVRCESCPPGGPTVVVTSETAPGEERSLGLNVEIGEAGSSARREHERRAARRQTRIDAAIETDTAWRQQIKQSRPLLGRLVAAVAAKPVIGSEPQHQKAWATGADGEMAVGRRLHTWATEAPGRYVLHDRRIPRTRANIDHLVVGPGGIWVIDAKEYQGKVEQVNMGGFIRADLRLKVGGRDRSKLAEGVRWQTTTVADAIAALIGEGPPDVRGMLCFVGADWSWFAKPFVHDGIHVAWPRAAVDLISAGNTLSPEEARRTAEVLARAFPAA